jgi:hypothetical protein
MANMLNPAHVALLVIFIVNGQWYPPIDVGIDYAKPKGWQIAKHVPKCKPDGLDAPESKLFYVSPNTNQDDRYQDHVYIKGV